VLGGNARTMAMLRGVQEGTIHPETLQRAVQAAGQKFGIEGAGKEPGTIIVRRMTEGGTIEQQAKATKALNEDFKMAVDPVSDAVARARNIAPETVEWISGVLNDAGPDATVRSHIFDDPEQLTSLMRRLADDQVIVSSELPRLMDPATNKLTPEGQRLIEASVIGRVIRNPKLIREMPAGLKNQVVTALSPLTRGEAFPNEWRLNNDIVNGPLAAPSGREVEQDARDDAPAADRVEPVPRGDAGQQGRARDRQVVRREQGEAERAPDRAQQVQPIRAGCATGQEIMAFETPKLPHEAANEAFGLKLSADDFATADGIEYVYSGLHPKAFEPLWKAVGEKARMLRDRMFIPKDVREPHVQGEPFREWWMRGELSRTGDGLRGWLPETWEKFARAAILNWEDAAVPVLPRADRPVPGRGHGRAREGHGHDGRHHPPARSYARDATGVFKRRPDAAINQMARQLNYLIGCRGSLGPLSGRDAHPGERVPRLGLVPA
jgi:hypothetical protein